MTLATETPAATRVGDLLAELRGVIDAREKLAQEDARLAARRQELKRELLGYHETTGVESLSAAGLSVGFDDDAVRAKYDPERWPEIVKWAVATGNDHIIQRRLKDSKVLDLVQSGIPLPEGLSLESFTKLNVQRK